MNLASGTADTSADRKRLLDGSTGSEEHQHYIRSEERGNSSWYRSISFEQNKASTWLGQVAFVVLRIQCTFHQDIDSLSIGLLWVTICEETYYIGIAVKGYFLHLCD